MILGGETADGKYVMPTIFDEAKAGSKIVKEEIFGPVLSVLTVSSNDEAIRFGE